MQTTTHTSTGLVELQPHELRLVSGGLPRGTWSETNGLPRGTWNADGAATLSDDETSLPRGTW